MPSFSKRSRDRLCGVHPDLQTLMNQVVQDFDITVICGLRTQEEQQALYEKGRKTPGQIVTYKDGVERRSKHQDGLAVDVGPWPLNWHDTERFTAMGWYIKGVANALKECGRIDNDIEWGGDWQFKDLPHFQIKSKG
jgi:peptidoglycan L-alanyl-D-glutamate endopeptidase CwlK